MLKKSQSIEYLLGLGLTALSLLAQQWMSAKSGSHFVLLYPTILIATFVFGTAVSILVAVFSIVGALLLCLSSPFSFHVDGLVILIQMLVYALTASYVIWIQWKKRRNEYELLISRDEFQSSFDAASVGMLQTAPETGRFLRVNSSFAKMLGYESSELIGKTFTQITHPDDRELNWIKFQQLLRGEIPDYRDQKRYIHKNGEVIWVAIVVNLVRDSKGKPVRMVVVVENITERKKLELERENALNLLKQISDRVPGVVYQFLLRPDGSFCFPYSSRGIRKIYRVSPEEVREDASKVFDIIYPDDRDGVMASIKKSFNELTPWKYEYRVKYNDGTVRWLLGNSLPQRNEDGSVLWHGFITDITQRKLLEESFSKEKLKTDDANRAKDMFLATLSHELRTPLTSILSWAQMLRRGGLDEEKTKMGIRAIEESAITQNQLIEDLLDISRIVAGKLLIERKISDLKTILVSAVDAIRPLAEKKSILIEEKIGEESMIVSVDPVRMKQVFWNLLFNAVKFTNRGGKINVSLSTVRDAQGNRVMISIHDTGKGITPEFLPHLFDRFTQSDISTIRAHGGLGLGLALVKNLLILQQGSVQAESPGEGMGSTFTVTLPLADPSMISQNETEVKNSNLSGIVILLVDDDHSTRVALNESLSFLGAKVTLASSVKEALQYFQRSIPDLLVSDISMPEEDGYSLIQKIRSFDVEHGGKVPAIALSAFADFEHQELALSSGFQEHVSKPVDIDMLGRVILNVIKKSSK